MPRDRVTIEDVAARAGVSPSTASRVVTGGIHVSEELAARVHSAIAELGYRPNMAARSLRQARSFSLGLVFHNLSNPTQVDLIKGIEQACGPAGYSLLVTDSHSDDGLYKELVHRLFERRVDGLFMVAPGDVGESLDDHIRAGVPVLALQSAAEQAHGVPLISTSERRATQQAVETLLRAGHTRIGQLAGQWERVRTRLLMDALSTMEAGTLTPVQLAQGGRDLEAALQRLMARPDRPTALFVNLQFLTATITCLRDLGYNLPDDLSLVSFGDAPWLALVQPPISAIRVDWHALGEFAAATMLEWLRGKRPRSELYAARATFERRRSIHRLRAG